MSIRALGPWMFTVETHNPHKDPVDTRQLQGRGVWGNEVSPQRGVGLRSVRSVPTEGCGFAKRARCPRE